MEVILRSLFTAILTSSVIVILAVLFYVWMVKIGAIPEKKGERYVIAIFVICLVMIKAVIPNDIPWWVWGIGVLLAVTFGYHRGHLSKALSQGRWWWKKAKTRNTRKNNNKG